MARVCLLVNLLIPVIHYHFVLDIIVRSSIITILFGSLIIGLRLAPDFADFFWKIVEMVFRKKH